MSATRELQKSSLRPALCNLVGIQAADWLADKLPHCPDSEIVRPHSGFYAGTHSQSRIWSAAAVPAGGAGAAAARILLTSHCGLRSVTLQH